MATTSRRSRAASPADDAPLTAATDANTVPPLLSNTVPEPVAEAAPAPVRRRQPAAARKTAPAVELAAEPQPRTAAKKSARKTSRAAPAQAPDAPQAPETSEAPVAAPAVDGAVTAAVTAVETAAAEAPAPVRKPARQPARQPARSRRRVAEPVPAPAVGESATVAQAPALAAPASTPVPAGAPVSGPPEAVAELAVAPATAVTEPASVSQPVSAPVPETAPEPAPAPQPPTPSLLTLAGAPGGARRLAWTAGRGCPDTLRLAVSRWQDADGALTLQEPEAVDELVALAARCGHRLVVDEAVWQQLALRGDLRQRIGHLEACFRQGLEAAEFAGVAAGPLAPRPAQREAAFFAACAGACLLADAEGLEPARELALAWQLVQRHFGARRLALHLGAGACEAVRDAWQALLAPLDGEATIRLLASSEPLPADGVDVLIVDQRAGWLPVPDAADATAPWLWVLAPEDALQAEPAAVEAWLARLDRLGTGAVAQGLAAATPEALAPLLLQRGWAEVADQWPAWAPQDRACAWPGESRDRHARAMTAAAALLARWQRSGFLSDSDQLALSARLAQAEAAGREAALAALPELLTQARGRLHARVHAVVFTQAEAAADLPAWADRLTTAGWPALVLPAHNREAEPVLRAFREADGPCLLLVADGLPGSEPRLPAGPPAPLVIHLDRPWDEAVRERRLERLRLPRAQRAVPVWQLLPEDSLAAHRQAQLAAVPPDPAARPPATGRLRRGSALQTWLGELAACLPPATAAVAPCPAP